MKYVYFLKYNNYANRIMKKENSVSDYLSEGSMIASISDVKLWNPNDGITTVITTPNNTDFSTEPDYVITSDDGSTVDSRWFVVETVRWHKGQYQCTLKRDVFAEAWDELMYSTCHIDRAILSKYSKLIFNQEPISVNQIIADEWEVKDKTGCPWIVFYGKEKPAAVSRSLSYNYDFTVSNIATYRTENNYNYLPEDEQDIQMVMQYAPTIDDAGLSKFRALPYGYQGNVSFPNIDSYFPYAKYTIHLTSPDSVSNYLSNFKTLYDLKGSADAQATMANNNKVAFDLATSKYYRIRSYYTDYHAYSERLNNSTLLNAMKYIVGNYTDVVFTSGHDEDNILSSQCRAYYTYKQMVTECTEIEDLDHIDAKVPAGGYEPSDSPYLIWAMPYGNITVKNTVSGATTTVTTDKNVNLSVAMKFSMANTSNKLYDFQIVPFCPLPDEYIKPDGSIEITDNADLTDNNTITKTVEGVTSTIGFIFSIPSASFSKRIMLDTPITVDDPKLRNITDTWRLSSPNYASSFEFSVAKNNGLTGFNVRCTYMPINPYIRVAPIFGGLYGTGFDENVRGLICGGDYSMARIADAWVNYQEQNKNFAAIFDRTIDNMDVLHGYDRTESIAQAVFGSVQGAIAGAFAGGTMGGGPFGAAAGAVVGGVGSAGAGIADIALGERRYNESKSYATDLHHLQLGNVQAMPRTLARTTAFNIDNRYFPILTLYRCSSDELLAVANFIKNRSMAVGIIDEPINYINNTWTFGGHSDRGFIQGSIINIDSIHDTHFVDELNSEFQKGAYLR